MYFILIKTIIYSHIKIKKLTNTSVSHQLLEIPLGNENFESRPPLSVELNKGWNKVLIKLPIGQFSIPEVRLTKWMFNAAFVTLDGKNSIEGLQYSNKPMIE